MLKKPNNITGKKSAKPRRLIAQHTAMMIVVRTDALMTLTVIVMIANIDSMTATTTIGQRVLGKGNCDAVDQTISLLPSSSLVPSTIIARSSTRCWMVRA